MPHPGLVFMRLIAPLPLVWLRGLGAGLGLVLYVLVARRRKIVMANLAACFPQRSLQERRQWTREVFVYFVQAWFDRAWLWHGQAQTVRQRLNLTGAVGELAGREPTVIFAPHFFGLDAAGTALNQQVDRPMTSIYSPQSNPAVDAWIHAGRRRFGQLRLFYRHEGVKPIISALRAGELLYLLADMNFDPSESVFVPFYGVTAATVPSLSRFAKLGRAKVVPVTARMTATGYDIEVHPAWPDFPSGDWVADTTVMNRWLESVIDTMPSQYYWVHRRFKDRPEGATPIY
jgi:Kdo2-lipid IVA lauroyltransferase/acyltransferase